MLIAFILQQWLHERAQCYVKSTLPVLLKLNLPQCGWLYNTDNLEQNTIHTIRHCVVQFAHTASIPHAHITARPTLLRANPRNCEERLLHFSFV